MEIRPLTEEDVPVLEAMCRQPEISRWGWDTIDDPDAHRFAIVLEDEVVGMVQFSEEDDPEYRYAWIDILLDRRFHGRGIGTEAVRLMVAHVFASGHHRITIDPAADNAAAIRCYEKAGFRPVGIQQQAWRDPDGVWRDVLLMEQVR